MKEHIADSSDIWIENNLHFDAVMIDRNFLAVTYAIIILSVFILCHSYQMHHGYRYTSIRLQTEGSALSALLASILFLVYKQTPNALTSAVIVDFFSNGLLNLSILLCDAYMFYYRLRAVIKVPKWKRNLVHCYIWICIVLPWFPAYNILPSFLNLNDPQFIKAYFISSTIVSANIVLYNVYITLEFTQILFSIYKPGAERSTRVSAANASNPIELTPALTKIKIVAIKSVGHCITSCSGVFCFTLVPGYGPLLQTFILIAGEFLNGMHLIFASHLFNMYCIILFDEFMCCTKLHYTVLYM